MSETDSLEDVPTEKPDGIPGMMWNQLPAKMQKVLGLLNSPDGLKEILLRPSFGEDPETGEPTTSQAEMIADVFNIMRLDVKAIGEAAGVEVEAGRMTPEKAAEMIQFTVQGNYEPLMEVINDIENKHERVLAEMEGEEAADAHRELKNSHLYSGQGVANHTVEDEGYDDE